eukprot:1159899-Pelagomonas_calceolata.AAC.3
MCTALSACSMNAGRGTKSSACCMNAGKGAKSSAELCPTKRDMPAFQGCPYKGHYTAQSQARQPDLVLLS